jgi:hypothetical protein
MVPSIFPENDTWEGTGKAEKVPYGSYGPREAAGTRSARAAARKLSHNR